MNQITIDDFKKLDIRIGKIISAEKIEWSEKLLKLVIDIGCSEIQVLSGIYPKYQPGDIVGKLVPVLVNLAPRKIKDLESQGMMLAAGDNDQIALLNPNIEIEPGIKIL